MFDFILLSIKSLTKKKLRTLLTIFSISIGVASVIIISNVSDFGKNAVTSEIDSLGLSGIAVSCSSDGTCTNSISADKIDIIKDNQDIDVVMPIIINSAKINLRNSTLPCITFGVDNNAKTMVAMEVIYGRNIENQDILSAKNVCLVDENVAQSSYKRDNIVGKTISININGSIETFEVVGIVKTGTGILQSMMGEYVPTFVYVPVSSLQKISGRDDYDQITVKLKNGVDTSVASEKIIKKLRAADNTGAKFTAENLSQQRQALENLMNIVSMVLSAISVISLIVAGIGIMTIMLVSVNERTREIGIKKSIGAKKSSILLEFIFEALILTLIGCIIGIVVGVGVVFIASFFLKLNITINFSIILLAIGISTTMGVLFGVYPAMKAANMKPVDALRTD